MNKSKRKDTMWPVFEKASSLAEVFEKYRDLDKTAFVFHGHRLSYKELHMKSDKLAAGLAEQGVGRGQTVALRMKRGLKAAISMAAVIKSGAALLPIEPLWPEEMAEEVCRIGHATFMIDENNYEELASCTLPFTTVPGAMDDIVTKLFTSGSSGKPKGVIGTNRNYLNSLLPYPENVDFHYRYEENLINLNTMNFTFSGGSIPYLNNYLVGNTMIIADEEESVSVESLAALMLGTDNLVMVFSYSNLRKYMESEAFCQGLRNVKQMILGWEKLPAEFLDEIRPYTDARVLVSYGSTEMNGMSTETIYKPGQISVGVPTKDTRIWILDDSGKEVSRGEKGEICVAGPRITQAYLGDESRNAEAFEDRPGWGRILHMGDMGYIQPDGQLVVTGRKDSMVKIRGFRVEPGQVEAAAVSCPGIGTAACKVQEQGGDAWLALYYTVEKNGDKIRREDIVAHLYEKLPYYMIPSAFVLLDHLPLTDRQKIDYQALPLAERGSGSADYQSPCGEKESILCEEAEHVLQSACPVSVTDTWFSAGGSSLSGIRLVQILRQRGYSLPVNELFGKKSFRDLAALMGELTEIEDDFDNRPYFEEGTGQEFFDEMAREKDGICLGSHEIEAVIKIDGLQKIYGIERYYKNTENVAAPVIFLDYPYTEETFAQKIRLIIERHPSLRAVLYKNDKLDFYLLIKKQGKEDYFYRDISYLADEDSPGKISDRQKKFLLSYRSLQIERQRQNGADLTPHFFCVRLSDDSCAVGLISSHVIADGISVDLLLKELSDRQMPKAGHDHYYAFLRACRQPLSREGKDFWEGYLTEKRYDTIPATGPNTGVPAAGRYQMILTGEDKAGVNKYCRDRNVSPSAGIPYFAGQALLETYGLKQYLFRMMFGCRESADFTDDAVGMLAVNRPVLVNEGQTIRDFHEQIKMIMRYPCPQEAPISSILNRAGFRENSFGITQIGRADESVEIIVDPFSEGARRLHDFVLIINEDKDGVLLTFDYDSDYQSEESVKRLADLVLKKIRDIRIKSKGE